MIRIRQMKLPVLHTEQQLVRQICKLLKIKESRLLGYRLVKKSIDARKKPQLWYVYSVDVQAEGEAKILKQVDDKNIMLIQEERYCLPKQPTRPGGQRPVVVGAGPAGLFCAYALTQAGCPPVVLERGRRVEERAKDVARFWETGILDTASNVQFGEGGAGTFSDGKLNTLVKDPAGRNRFVLETFVKFGAPEQILYENKPHVGTDVLSDVIRNMRLFMEEAGACFCFESCMTDYAVKDGRISAAEINHERWIETDRLVLAVGHSARDTFRMLHAKGTLGMEAKSFAVGFRVEHPQDAVNRLQYGETYADLLPAAAYKVTANMTANLPSKLPLNAPAKPASAAAPSRGVYSFCMCPGGYVVNASSEDGRLAVNGMSYSGRSGKNANSAIIVSVTPADFGAGDALAGVRFQERLEEAAYRLGGGRIPQQLFGDYCANRVSEGYGAFESAAKGAVCFANLRGLLPAEAEEAFIAGMHVFGQRLSGFDRADAVLSGVESRTSSPVRIPRDLACEAFVRGIYPCGEGAGYAGGITSAAMDGLRVAEQIVSERN